MLFADVRGFLMATTRPSPPIKYLSASIPRFWTFLDTFAHFSDGEGPPLCPPPFGVEKPAGVICPALCIDLSQISTFATAGQWAPLIQLLNGRD